MKTSFVFDVPDPPAPVPGSPYVPPVNPPIVDHAAVAWYNLGFEYRPHFYRAKGRFPKQVFISSSGAIRPYRESFRQASRRRARAPLVKPGKSSSSPAPTKSHVKVPAAQDPVERVPSAKSFGDSVKDTNPLMGERNRKSPKQIKAMGPSAAEFFFGSPVLGRGVCTRSSRLVRSVKVTKVGKTAAWRDAEECTERTSYNPLGSVAKVPEVVHHKREFVYPDITYIFGGFDRHDARTTFFSKERSLDRLVASAVSRVKRHMPSATTLFTCFSSPAGLVFARPRNQREVDIFVNPLNSPKFRFTIVAVWYANHVSFLSDGELGPLLSLFRVPTMQSGMCYLAHVFFVALVLGVRSRYKSFLSLGRYPTVESFERRLVDVFGSDALDVAYRGSSSGGVFHCDLTLGYSRVGVGEVIGGLPPVRVHRIKCDTDYPSDCPPTWETFFFKGRGVGRVVDCVNRYIDSYQFPHCRLYSYFTNGRGDSEGILVPMSEDWIKVYVRTHLGWGVYFRKSYALSRVLSWYALGESVSSFIDEGFSEGTCYLSHLNRVSLETGVPYRQDKAVRELRNYPTATKLQWYIRWWFGKAALKVPLFCEGEGKLIHATSYGSPHRVSDFPHTTRVGGSLPQDASPPNDVEKMRIISDLMGKLQNNRESILVKSIEKDLIDFSKSVSDLNKGKESVHVPFSISERVQVSLTKSYPEFNITFSHSTHSDHGAAAASRVLENALLHKYAGSNYADVGGCPLYHVNNRHISVHVCRPLLDIKDAQRRIMRHRGYDNMKLDSDEVSNLTAMLSNLSICCKPVDECTHKSKTFTMVQVYDIPLPTLFDAMITRDCDITYATMITPGEILDGRDQFFVEDLGCEVKLNEAEDRLTYSFSGSVYTHSLKTVLSYMKNPVTVYKGYLFTLEMTSLRNSVNLYVITKSSVYPDIHQTKVMRFRRCETDIVRVKIPNYCAKTRVCKPGFRYLYLDSKFVMRVLGHIMNTCTVVNSKTFEWAFTFTKAATSRVVVSGKVVYKDVALGIENLDGFVAVMLAAGVRNRQNSEYFSKKLALYTGEASCIQLIIFALKERFMAVMSSMREYVTRVMKRLFKDYLSLEFMDIGEPYCTVSEYAEFMCDVDVTRKGSLVEDEEITLLTSKSQDSVIVDSVSKIIGSDSKGDKYVAPHKKNTKRGLYGAGTNGWASTLVDFLASINYNPISFFTQWVLEKLIGNPATTLLKRVVHSLAAVIKNTGKVVESFSLVWCACSNLVRMVTAPLPGKTLTTKFFSSAFDVITKFGGVGHVREFFNATASYFHSLYSGASKRVFNIINNLFEFCLQPSNGAVVFEGVVSLALALLNHLPDLLMGTLSLKFFLLKLVGQIVLEYNVLSYTHDHTGPVETNKSEFFRRCCAALAAAVSTRGVKFDCVGLVQLSTVLPMLTRKLLACVLITDNAHINYVRHAGDDFPIFTFFKDMFQSARHLPDEICSYLRAQVEEYAKRIGLNGESDLPMSSYIVSKCVKRIFSTFSRPQISPTEESSVEFVECAESCIDSLGESVPLDEIADIAEEEIGEGLIPISQPAGEGDVPSESILKRLLRRFVVSSFSLYRTRPGLGGGSRCSNAIVRFLNYLCGLVQRVFPFNVAAKVLESVRNFISSFTPRALVSLTTLSVSVSVGFVYPNLVPTSLFLNFFTGSHLAYCLVRSNLFRGADLCRRFEDTMSKVLCVRSKSDIILDASVEEANLRLPRLMATHWSDYPGYIPECDVISIDDYDVNLMSDEGDLEGVNNLVWGKRFLSFLFKGMSCLALCARTLFVTGVVTNACFSPGAVSAIVYGIFGPVVGGLVLGSLYDLSRLSPHTLVSLTFTSVYCNIFESVFFYPRVVLNKIKTLCGLRPEPLYKDEVVAVLLLNKFHQLSIERDGVNTPDVSDVAAEEGDLYQEFQGEIFEMNEEEFSDLESEVDEALAQLQAEASGGLGGGSSGRWFVLSAFKAVCFCFGKVVKFFPFKSAVKIAVISTFSANKIFSQVLGHALFTKTFLLRDLFILGESANLWVPRVVGPLCSCRFTPECLRAGIVWFLKMVDGPLHTFCRNYFLIESMVIRWVRNHLPAAFRATSRRVKTYPALVVSNPKRKDGDPDGAGGSSSDFITSIERTKEALLFSERPVKQAQVESDLGETEAPPEGVNNTEPEKCDSAVVVGKTKSPKMDLMPLAVEKRDDEVKEKKLRTTQGGKSTTPLRPRVFGGKRKGTRLSKYLERLNNDESVPTSYQEADRRSEFYSMTNSIREFYYSHEVSLYELFVKMSALWEDALIVDFEPQLCKATKEDGVFVVNFDQGQAYGLNGKRSLLDGKFISEYEFVFNSSGLCPTEVALKKNGGFCIVHDSLRFLAANAFLLNMPSRFIEYTNYEASVRVFEAPPGGGKTHALVDTYISLRKSGKKSVVIVTANKNSQEEIVARCVKGFCEHGLEYVQAQQKSTTIYTVDAYLMHHTNVKCDVLLVDECFMIHNGAVAATINFTGAKKCAFYGDSRQIHYIHRNELGISEYHDLNMFIPDASRVFGDVSYRCPWDVCEWLSTFYPRHVRSVAEESVGKSSMSTSEISSENDVPERPGFKYITFTQAEKRDLQKRFDLSRFRTVVQTVHEVQGETYSNVALVRIKFQDEAPFTSLNHITVALSRHTDSLTYYHLGQKKFDEINGHINNARRIVENFKGLPESLKSSKLSYELGPMHEQSGECKAASAPYEVISLFLNDVIPGSATVDLGDLSDELSSTPFESGCDDVVIKASSADVRGTSAQAPHRVRLCEESSDSKETTITSGKSAVV
uniref:Putative polyprotein 1a n=1 Tax=Rose leaf rosette-associated virus TaxID=1543207 RepID=A0A7U1BML2_9CLOS|nr:putative polyprotein 1a [Rose leaf rosette-associated virus]